MAQQQIGVGTVANDNTGDPIRDAFVKVNDNFDEAYGAGLIDSNIVTPGNEDTPTTVNANGITTSVDNADFTVKANGTGQIILDDVKPKIVNALSTPTGAGAAGDTIGDVRFDINFIYICVTDYPNGTAVWKTAPLSALA